ncbi:MAG: bile acid:sodium symporter family protein [Myxococcota bacterium]
MQSNVLTAVFMPIALGIIMLGLGLTLTLEDFKRIFQMPKPVFVGLFSQVVVLPLACLGLAEAFSLPPELAVGLMLLAASPGGATANLYSHLAKGDVALNITLTATNSILSLFTLPFIVNYSLQHFMGDSKVLPLQFDKVIQVFAIVLVPVGIGMLVRARNQALALRLDKPVKILSALFLLLIIGAAVAKEWANLPSFVQQVGAAALAFNLVSMGVGYIIPMLVQIPKRQAIAISMEIGIHNGTLAIAIASSPSLLNNSTMAIPAAIYSLIMFFTAAAFGYAINRVGSSEPASSSAS